MKVLPGSNQANTKTRDRANVLGGMQMEHADLPQEEKLGGSGRYNGEKGERPGSAETPHQKQKDLGGYIRTRKDPNEGKIQRLNNNSGGRKVCWGRRGQGVRCLVANERSGDQNAGVELWGGIEPKKRNCKTSRPGLRRGRGGKGGPMKKRVK